MHTKERLLWLAQIDPPLLEACVQSCHIRTSFISPSPCMTLLEAADCHVWRLLTDLLQTR